MEAKVNRIKLDEIIIDDIIIGCLILDDNDNITRIEIYDNCIHSKDDLWALHLALHNMDKYNWVDSE